MEEEIAGYVIVIQNWYSMPAGSDTEWAATTSLNQTASVGDEGAKLVKQSYQVLEVPEYGDVFNTSRCRQIGEPYYEILEEAQETLKEYP